MVFHENRLLAEDSDEKSYLIFSKIGKDVAKFVVCCSHDWRFKGVSACVISPRERLKSACSADEIF